LLRAGATPPGYSARCFALAAAAAELGRFHRDMEVVDRALRIVRDPMGGDPLCVTLDEARNVVRKELASPEFPSPFKPGPDYSKLLPEGLCQCPDCRRRRGDGEGVEDDEFDEAQMEKIFKAGAPKDMPPEIAGMLFDVMKEAYRAGLSPDEVVSQILGEMRGKHQKQGRKKR
jgi:hypothetical protein